MYTEAVQYSSAPAAVSMTVRPDGCAEYRLTKDVTTEQDNDGNDVIQGKEVYFEVMAGQPQPTVEEVALNFDAYWASGISWTAKRQTLEERLAVLESDNMVALEAIAELYEMQL